MEEAQGAGMSIERGKRVNQSYTKQEGTYNVIMDNQMAKGQFIQPKAWSSILVMYYVASHIRITDMKFEEVKFHYSELDKLLEEPKSVGFYYDAVRGVLKDLQMEVGTKTYNLVSYVDWRDGKITVKLNDDVIPFFLQLNSNFTRLPLAQLVNNTPKTDAIYRLIMSQHNASRFLKIPPQDLGILMKMAKRDRYKKRILEHFDDAKSALETLGNIKITYNYATETLSWKFKVRE